MTAKRKRIDEQLRAAIKASGLTHYRIAKDAGLSPELVARYVSGERDMRMSSAAAIADVLGLELTKRNS